MRFRGMSIMMVGAATLLLAVGPDADAQRGRLGVLRPAPRPSPLGGRPRPASIAPYFFPEYWFFNSCFVVAPFPSFFPFFGGLPFMNVQVFAGGQPSPDPTAHLIPDPTQQPVPFPGSHPLPGVQPVPGAEPVPVAAATNPHAVTAYAAPVYSAPVYAAPVYAAAAPIATPRVSGGMVVGDVIVDPTWGLWGGSFFGGGVICAPRNSRVIIR
jgi:hypothetical protein